MANRIRLAALALLGTVAMGTAAVPDAARGQTVNYTPYDEAFMTRLLSGRVWVYTQPARPPEERSVAGYAFFPGGEVAQCLGRKTAERGEVFRQFGGRWWMQEHRSGRMLAQDVGPPAVKLFYDPVEGGLHTEVLADGAWLVVADGWLQEGWPAAFLDACPSLPLPKEMAIEERQDVLDAAAMREAAPDAIVRRFPGSDLRAPGRTGIGKARGGPTTTREEAAAWIAARRGGVLLTPSGSAFVLTDGWDAEGEIWHIGPDGRAAAFGRLRLETDDAGREWAVASSPGLPEFRYEVGYPSPLRPTGRRHPAFRLTDRLVESGEPVALPWMPAMWKDFEFRADGTVLARPADGGPARRASWQWTEERLRVEIEGNREMPRWEEVARALDMDKPTALPAAGGQRVERTGQPPAAGAPASSGTARCTGGYEGVATWTLGADGGKVWDLSGCRETVAGE